MNERMLALRQRRGELLARIDRQRGQLGGLASSWEGQLAMVDRGVAMVRYFRSHPLLFAGLSAYVVLRRKGITGLISSILLIRRGYRFFAGLTSKR